MENSKLYNQINHRINKSSYRVSASAFNKKFSFAYVMVNLMLENEELPIYYNLCKIYLEDYNL